MERLRRSERLVYITKYLFQHPREVIGLNFFAKVLGAAKSSISEDLTLIKGALTKLELGRIETEMGAAGGVQYIPLGGTGPARELAEELCGRLARVERIIPGGFLYLTDIVFSPQVAARVGEIFAAQFSCKGPEYVITVETKGVPIALQTAYFLGVPLVVARREHRVTEGSAVSITYVTGSSRRIQTMSLARRALPTEARVVVIDDFMKAGGTARGLHELLGEFNTEIVGTGVLMETAVPREKLIRDYLSLLVLDGVDETAQEVRVRPSRWVAGGEGR